MSTKALPQVLQIKPDEPQDKSKRPKKLPPWKRPSRFLWFCVSLCIAAYLILHMPEKNSSKEDNLPQNVTQSIHEDNILQKTLPSHAYTDQETKKNEQNDKKKLTEASFNRNFDKILTKSRTFARLFTFVGLAAFLGALIEARSWHRFFIRFSAYVSRFARLPLIIGIAMPTALVSSSAANSLLVASHEEGEIPTFSLIAGGMANSYLSYISHSLRVVYPVIGAIGLPGLLYFIIQFSGGFLLIFGLFCWNRWQVGKKQDSDNPRSAFSHLSENIEEKKYETLSWPNAFEKALVRSLTLLFRLVCITVPLMLGIEWLLKNGTFDMWDELVPAQISRFFPLEAISIVATQLGGLVQSSAVSSNLRAEGLINNAQILLAMLIGSTVGNPIRTLRRNLPSALAIFPARVACIIVFTMQTSRLIITLTGIVATVFFMEYVLYV